MLKKIEEKRDKIEEKMKDFNRNLEFIKNLCEYSKTKTLFNIQNLIYKFKQNDQKRRQD